MNRLRQQINSKNLYLLLGLIIVYPLVIYPATLQFGRLTQIVILIPVIYFFYTSGLAWGLIVSAIFTGVNFVITFNEINDVTFAMLIQFIINHATVVVFGYTGWRARVYSDQASNELEKHTEVLKALKQEKALLNTLFEKTYRGLCVLKPISRDGILEFKVIRANSAVESAFGISNIKSQYDDGDLWLSLCGWPDEIAQICRGIWEQKTQITCSINLDSANGNRWFLLKSIIADDNIFIVLEDKTDDIDFQRSLKASLEMNQMLSLVAKYTHNGVMIIDVNKKIRWTNAGFTRLTGYELIEVQGKAPGSFLNGPETNVNTSYYMANAFDKMERFRCEIQNLNKDQSTTWVRIEGMPIFDVLNRFEGYILIETDIEPQRRYEASILQSKRAADDASRIKDQFLTNISHELRTPLNAIIGLTTLLQDTPLDDEQVDYVETIGESGEDLLDIVRNILDFTDSRSADLQLDFEPLFLNHLVEKLHQIGLEKLGQKSLTFDCQIADGVPDQIYGDSDRIYQVLYNLWGNAFKFTESGTIALFISCVHVEGARYVQFAIEDTGIGINQEEMDALFQPFRQLDGSLTRRHGGAGIGLVSSRELARAMGGEVFVESKSGVGTTAYFRIPLVQMEEGTPQST